MVVLSHNTVSTLGSRRKSERPSTAVSNVVNGTKILGAGQKIPNSKFDFVCTSEACFRIKKKLNATAFGKNTNSTPNLLGADEKEENKINSLTSQDYLSIAATIN